MTDEVIERTFARYGLRSTPNLRSEIQKYVAMLLRWNQKISLTAITDPLEILRFHFAESMFASNAVPIQSGRLADVGSGPGFPGLALKLMVPSLELVLMESNGKKASFLSECVRQLGLSRVEVYHGRFEDFPADDSQFDFITARALGGFSELEEWSRTRMSQDGLLVLWLGERDADELKSHNLFAWRAPITIPESARRVLLVGEQH